jgi:hypothetical protein
MGGIEKICDPRGCSGDCVDDTKVCYVKIKCKKGEGWSSWYCGDGCQITDEINPLVWCYPCIEDTSVSREEVLVQNDYCS